MADDAFAVGEGLSVFAITITVERVEDYAIDGRASFYMPVRMRMQEHAAAEETGLNFQWVKDTSVFEEGSELQAAYPFQSGCWRVMIDSSQDVNCADFLAFAGIECVVTPNDQVLPRDLLRIEEASSLADHPVGSMFNPNFMLPIVQYQQQGSTQPVRLLLPDSEIEFAGLKNSTGNSSAWVPALFQWIHKSSVHSVVASAGAHPQVAAMYIIVLNDDIEDKRGGSSGGGEKVPQVAQILRPNGEDYLASFAAEMGASAEEMLMVLNGSNIVPISFGRQSQLTTREAPRDASSADPKTDAPLPSAAGEDGRGAEDGSSQTAACAKQCKKLKVPAIDRRTMNRRTMNRRTINRRRGANTRRAEVPLGQDGIFRLFSRLGVALQLSVLRYIGDTDEPEATPAPLVDPTDDSTGILAGMDTDTAGGGGDGGADGEGAGGGAGGGADDDAAADGEQEEQQRRGEVWKEVLLPLRMVSRNWAHLVDTAFPHLREEQWSHTRRKGLMVSVVLEKLEDYTQEDCTLDGSGEGGEGGEGREGREDDEGRDGRDGRQNGEVGEASEVSFVYKPIRVTVSESAGGDSACGGTDVLFHWVKDTSIFQQ
jgi:hypothetical protein